MKQLLTFLIVSSLTFTGLVAQEEPAFSVRLSTDSVLMGNYFVVEFTLENAEGSQFEPPVFEGFSVVGGPNTSSSYSMINEKVSRSMTYSFYLEPRETGNYYIPPASIAVGEKILETQPVEVMVYPNPEGIRQEPRSMQNRLFEFRMDGFDDFNLPGPSWPPAGRSAPKRTGPKEKAKDVQAMTIRSLIFLTTALLAPLVLPAQSQQAVVFEAFADARQVVLNSFFNVSFTLKNGEGRDFTPPPFNDFIVVAGPSRSVRTTLINGNYSSEVSYSYELQPKRVGRFTIGRASVKVNGKTFQTDPLSITVVEGSALSGKEGENEVFVRAEPSTTVASVGQQIVLDYKLYTAIDIDNYNVIEESDYPGFYAQDIRRYDSRSVREVIDGVLYVTKVLKRIALFPQQAGALVIDPMTVQLGVITEESRRRSGFFFNKQIQRIPVTTEPVNIDVNPLPPDPPPTYTGAVGQYRASASLSKSQFTTDDAVSIKLAVSGNGDIKRVQAPEMELPESFERYDPRVIEESTYEMNGVLSGKKVFEYLAVPKEAGYFTLQAPFSYYDPDSARYVTVKGESFDITVRQGANQGTRPALPGTEAVPREDIRFIKTDTSLSQGAGRFFGTPLFWTLALLPLLLLGGSAFVKYRQGRLGRIDPAILRSRRARQMAEKRLSVAEQYLKTSDSRAFYDEVSKAMLGYVCDKLKIPRSELTKDNVRGKLQSLEVSSEHIDRFMKVIHNAEIALFAGMDNTAAMKETYENAVEVLSGIEASVAGN